MIRPRTQLGLLSLVALALLAAPALAQYERPVEAAPTEEDIGGGYVTPSVQHALPRAYWLVLLDAGLLAAALAVSCWLVLARRSRTGLLALAIVCLAYFGFYREGCICPIGAIQNVAAALTDPDYAISHATLLVFFLPLLLAVPFGRVFCGGVCPLGAIQELVLLKPLRVPRRLDRLLGLLKYAYLLLALWYAVRPAVERDFIICRFDPFVGLFRMTGPGYMLMIGGAFLLLGVFVGRPYCRYLCPYGALLALLSRFSRWGVTITPDQELDCGLCTDACPYGAIEQMRAVRSSCLFCARCYQTCPRERARVRLTTPVSAEPKPTELR
ncbi:MAG: 4Fe-4S binding protein [Planctomycetes bacterium]|nr:4Fe-4S binding protein [Planctomycetota bacterium]